MAKPTDFPESNQNWVGPPGNTDVGDLPTLTEDARCCPAGSLTRRRWSTPKYTARYG